MSATIDGVTGLSENVRRLITGPSTLIGGVWEAGEDADVNTSTNPSSGAVIDSVQASSVDQARRAVQAARRAFDSGPWGRTTPRERGELLRNLTAIVDRHRDELVELVISEVGAPLRLARAMQVGMPIDNLAWSAEMAVKGPPGGYEEALLPHAGPPASASLLRREPVGVVSAITGYNFPINSLVWKLGPGLAAGCTFVVKSSPRTPLSTLAFIHLLEQAELPPGVVNVVFGGAEVGEVLTADPDVDMVMFTGSGKVGASVMASASRTTKRLVLELGGKSATIVLPGVNVTEVVAQSTLRFCRMSGQACGATTRTLVPREMYDEFAAGSRAFIDTLAVGDPWDEATEIGPLISSQHRGFVEGRVEQAISGGGVLEAGGGRPDGFENGFFMNPAVVGRVTNDDPICRDELFGPVGTLLPYDSVDEAISLANDSDYGLYAAVFGPPMQAMEVSRHLRAGAVGLNGGGAMHPRGPWGGYKQSGFGREMGDEGFREFFQVKHVQWPIR